MLNDTPFVDLAKASYLINALPSCLAFRLRTEMKLTAQFDYPQLTIWNIEMDYLRDACMDIGMHVSSFRYGGKPVVVA